MKEIGKVVLDYNEEGAVINSNFTPTIQLEAEDLLLKKLNTLKSTINKEIVVKQAQFIFSSWFNLMTAIELNEDVKLHSKVMECQHYNDTGLVKRCVITFSFEN